MFLFETHGYQKQLHGIFLKAERNPNVSVSNEIRKLANDDELLAEDLLQKYIDKYGFPSDVIAKTGYVYLMKADGFYGVLSGIFGRYKIGKSNSPQRRHTELNGQQAPCPIKMLRFIQVDNMSKVESALHRQFKGNRKHGEWFDFWFWELMALNFAYQRYQNDFKRNKLASKSNQRFKKSLTSILAIAVVGLASGLFVYSLVSTPTTANHESNTSTKNH